MPARHGRQHRAHASRSLKTEYTRPSWVTPAAIKAKAVDQTKRVLGALNESCLALNVVGQADITKPEDTDGETSGI